MQQKMNFIIIKTALILGLSSCSYASRMVEKLDRGLIGICTETSKVFLSWRLNAYESQKLEFNLYRDGVKLNSTPITGATNYIDNIGNSTASYKICAVLNGVEIDSSATVKPWPELTRRIPLNKPVGANITYSPNDASVGDLDGDGEWDIVLKWEPSNSQDNANSGTTGNVYLDGLKLDGTHLWRIDLGKNIRAGAHYTQFLVADFDLDGKAEIICKTAPGTKDGSGNYIKTGPASSANHSADYRNSGGYILDGPEYLTVFNCEGKELATVNYNPPRGDVNSWGDKYGNRVDRFLAAVACLDGVRPSAVMQRGYYTRMTLAAWNWDGKTLSQKWFFDSNSSGNGKAAGQGNHNLSVGDVDGDGFDEIIQGSSAIDHDGKLMYATGIGHGDAIHLSDLDPDRPGLELMSPHEEKRENWPGTEVHDARTGAKIWQFLCTNVDVGRGIAADIDGKSRGFEVWSSNTDGIYNIKGNRISTIKPSVNFRIYWDGDLQDELLDVIGSTPSPFKIEHWNGSGFDRLLTTDNRYGKYHGISINGTKANPCLVADILGDWREEMILREDGDNALILYSTTIPTEHRLYTLMHDPVYRAAVAWQNVAYNQPPHLGIYIGDGVDNIAIPDVKPVTEIEYDCAGVQNGTATVDECGHCSGGITGESPCTGMIQFEDTCSANGTIDNNHTGFIGDGFLNLSNSIGSSVFVSVNSSESGEYSFYLRFSNGTADNRSVSVKVNGITQIESLDMPGTGSWTTWDIIPLTLKLLKGNNHVTLTSLTENGAANLDILGFTSEKLGKGICDSLPTGTLLHSKRQIKQKVRIFNDKLILSGFDKNCEIRIMNLHGQVIFKAKSPSQVQSLSMLGNGAYVVEIYQTGVLIQKLKTIHY